MSDEQQQQGDAVFLANADVSPRISVTNAATTTLRFQQDESFSFGWEDVPKFQALLAWDKAMQGYLQATADAEMAGRLGLTNDETWDASVRAQDAYNEACDALMDAMGYEYVSSVTDLYSTSTGALGGYGWRKKQ